MKRVVKSLSRCSDSSVQQPHFEPLEPRQLFSTGPLVVPSGPTLAELAEQAGVDVGAVWPNKNNITRTDRLSGGVNATTLDQWANYFDTMFTQATVGSHPNRIIGNQDQAFRLDNDGVWRLRTYDSLYNYEFLNNFMDELIKDQGRDVKMYHHALIYPNQASNNLPGQNYGWIDPRNPTLTDQDIVDLQDDYITKVIDHIHNYIPGDPSVVFEVWNELIGARSANGGPDNVTLGGNDLTLTENAFLRARRNVEPGYSLTAGAEYILDGFRAADAAATSNDVLLINESIGAYWSLDTNSQLAEDFYDLVEWIDDADVGLDAVGLQMHLHHEAMIDLNWLTNYIAQFEALGLDVYITELDIGLPSSIVDSNLYPDNVDAGVEATPNGEKLPNPTFYVTNGDNPYAGWDSELQTQRQNYYDVVSTLLDSEAVKSINFWGLHDNLTWRDNLEGLFAVREPVSGGPQAGEYAPKPAFFGVRDAFVDHLNGPPASGQTPYDDVVRNARNWVEAEYFDEGGQAGSPGEGFTGSGAYNDNDTADKGNSPFRNGEGVDLGNKSNATGPNGGTAVGYTGNGEWLEYTVNNLAPGDYTFELRYSSNSGNPGDVQVSVDGENIGTVTDISDTDGSGNNGWNTFVTASKSVNIASSGSGERIVRLRFTGGGFDIDKFRFVANSGATTARLQAESFTGDISDNGQNNANGAQWDRQGGHIWVPNGFDQWFVSNGQPDNASPRISKTLSGMQSGQYRVKVRANVNSGGDNNRGANDSFFLRVGGQGNWTYVNLNTNSGGWFTQTLTGPVSLSSGNNLIEIAAREDGTRIDWIEFEKI